MNNETTTSQSTGPITDEGKAISSQNAIKDGLYTREAYIRPGEEAEYEDIKNRIFIDLIPDGMLEIILAEEIVNATWRLRRCSVTEGRLVDQTLIDPMEDEAFEKKQRSIDRARAHAHTIIRRSIAELRKLQTERATRRELEVRWAESVLVDTQKVSRNIETQSAREDIAEKRWEKLEKKTQEQMFAELDRLTAPPVPIPTKAA